MDPANTVAGAAASHTNPPLHDDTMEKREMCDEGDGLATSLRPRSQNNNVINNNNNNSNNNNCDQTVPEIFLTTAPQMDNQAEASQETVRSNPENCRRSPVPVTVHSLFDWYFDSSDEEEELNEKSQCPEDLRKMFHSVLSKRCIDRGSVDDDPYRAKPERPESRHQTPPPPQTADDSCNQNMDSGGGGGGTGGGGRPLSASMGASHPKKMMYGREFDEEEQLKGHYDDVINVFKGVCYDLDDDDE